MYRRRVFEMGDINQDGGMEEALFDAYELEASHSFLSYFINDYNKTDAMINFADDTLRNTLKECRGKEGQFVILYAHKNDDEFSREFCEALAKRDENGLADTLEDSSIFSIVAWDISAADDVTRDALKNAVSSTLGPNFSDYISHKKSIALLIDQSSNVCLSCDDKVHLEKFVSIVKEFKELVHRMNGDNSLDAREFKSSVNFQQRMLELLGDRDYDSFEPDESDLLRCKIGFHLYGPPDLPIENETINIFCGGYSKEGADTKIDNLLEKIITENNKYCKWNGRVVIRFIYICTEPLAREKQKRKKNFKKGNNQNQEYNPESDFMPVPLFVIRKCKKSKKSKNEDHPGSFCCLYIDEDCRVYQSWGDYLNNNKLPPCLMVCPHRGKYQPESEISSNVWLEEHFSPSSHTSKKVLNVADAGLGLGGLGAAGLAMIMSTRGGVIGAVLGIGGGIYAVGRGVFTLLDRHKHGQGTQLLLYGVSAMALGISGVGIGNTIYEMWNQGEQPTALQLLQLGASIFFFGNSVYNFRAVGTVIDESQARALSEIEGNLSSNRMRKTFNKMLKETMRMEGNTAGKAEVIAAMRKMNNPDEVVRILNRNNKNFNTKGIRFAVKDGNIALNGQKVDIMDVSRMSSFDKSSFLSGLPPIPENLTPNVQYSINREFNAFLQNNPNLLRATTNLAVGNIAVFVNEVLSAFEQIIREFIYELTKKFCQWILNMEGEIVECVAKLFPGQNLFLLIIKWICNTLTRISAFQNIRDGHKWNPSDIDTILEDIMLRFRTWLTDLLYDKESQEDRKEKRREVTPIKTKQDCKKCSGHFYVYPK